MSLPFEDFQPGFSLPARSPGLCYIGFGRSATLPVVFGNVGFLPCGNASIVSLAF